MFLILTKKWFSIHSIHSSIIENFIVYKISWCWECMYTSVTDYILYNFILEFFFIRNSRWPKIFLSSSQQRGQSTRNEHPDQSIGVTSIHQGSISARGSIEFEHCHEHLRRDDWHVHLWYVGLSDRIQIRPLNSYISVSDVVTHIIPIAFHRRFTFHANSKLHTLVHARQPSHN